MKFTLRVDYTDGTDVTTDAVTVDILDYENEWQRSFLAALDDLRANDLYWLAWKSLQRNGGTELEWRPWQLTVDNVKWLQNEVTPRPLARKSRSRSSSSDSPTTSESPSPS